MVVDLRSVVQDRCEHELLNMSFQANEVTKISLTENVGESEVAAECNLTQLNMA